MTNIKVKVTRVGEKTGNNLYIHTVKTEGKKVEVLGQTKEGGASTYFIALPNKTALGTQHEIDMDKFTVTERPYDVPVTDAQGNKTGEFRTLQLKWLHIK